MAHEENFDIAEKVARGLAMRSHETIYLTPRDHEGLTPLVGGFQYSNSMMNGSYSLTSPALDENYDSSTVSTDSEYGMYTSSSYPTSTRKRSTVGRKPPRGLDGVRRYSSRRSTYERRDRINSRERDRMHQLCDAFERLRQVLPRQCLKKGPNRQKLSKISTLVLAQNYIRALELMLEENPDDTPTSTAELHQDLSISSQTNITQANGYSAAYYPVGDAGDFENSSGTVQYSHEVDHMNVNYKHDYYRIASMTQCQYTS